MFLPSKNHASATMPADIMDMCLAYGKIHTYAAKSQIHDRGDRKPGLSIVYAGKVEVGNYDVEGRYYLTAVLGKGETFGEFTVLANLPRTHNVTALEECQILQINANEFTRMLVEAPEINQFLLSSLAIRLHRVLEKLDDVVRLPTHVQVAKLLYQAYQMHGQPMINMRQQDIAKHLGVTVLTIHKAVKQLTQEELITTSYGAIIINDVNTFIEWLDAHEGFLPIT